jgi:hypothetical protein
LGHIVYMLGAGINRELPSAHNMRPPLALDLFEQALKIPRFTGDGYRTRLKPLYSYIEWYWKLGIEQLATRRLDIEECFTLLQLQEYELRKEGDTAGADRLAECARLLTGLLAEVLEEFNVHHSLQLGGTEPPLVALARTIVSERASVLTFNNDTLLEQCFEFVGGLGGRPPASLQTAYANSAEISDEVVGYSHYRWNRLLSYGVQFDYVKLHFVQASSWPAVDKARFYAVNGLYERPMLKLHGSVNWFRYAGRDLGGGQNPRSGQSIISVDGWWNTAAPSDNGFMLRPLIITPVLHKQFDDPLIDRLWRLAAEELARCSRLVIGGYSFPATDFYTRRLLLETFAANKLDELVIINPDERVVPLARELCHFDGPIEHHRSLAQYVGD